jgi:hypothetical protein
MKGRSPIFCVFDVVKGCKSSAAEKKNSRHTNHHRFFSCPGFRKSAGAIPGVHKAIISEARILARTDNRSDDLELKGTAEEIPSRTVP